MDADWRKDSRDVIYRTILKLGAMDGYEMTLPLWDGYFSK
jgi:hypothetical protein